MDLPRPLHEGRLIRRYKRFLADIDLGGETVTAHCPNPGAMTGLNAPGLRAWLSRSDDPKRKLPYTLELLEADGGLVGINTGRPNAIVAEAVAAGTIPELAGYPVLRREVRYGTNSRVDLLLDCPTRGPCHVEVKNVHLRRPDGPNPGAAEFPDSVTVRGAKHLEELATVAAAGGRAVMMFCVQRMDCDRVVAAADIDRRYAEGLARAVAAGVEAIAWDCAITPDRITLRRPLPVVV